MRGGLCGLLRPSEQQNLVLLLCPKELVQFTQGLENLDVLLDALLVEGVSFLSFLVHPSVGVGGVRNKAIADDIDCTGDFLCPRVSLAFGHRRLHMLLVVVLPCLVVEPLVKERNPLDLEARYRPRLGDDELDYPTPDVRLNLELAHEGVLVFGGSRLNDVNFAGVAILGLVVVTDKQNSGFFPALIRLDYFLH